jgi:hypothetical protein
MLLAGWLMHTSYLDARKHLPLQFRGEETSRYYMQYATFDPSFPWPVRRRMLASALAAMTALVGFATVAGLSGHFVAAAAFVLACFGGAANLLWQWRRSYR